MRTIAILLLLALFAAFGLAADSAGDGVLMRALSDELDRSMAMLRVEGLERPYFIAYRVDEVESHSVAATFGSLLIGRTNRSRQLTVQIRLGGYELDNSNFLSIASLRSRSGGALDGRSRLTLDDDYREIRRQVWLATDAAFKKALEQLAQKQAVLQNKTLAEELPDFGRAETFEIRHENPSTEVDLRKLERLATELSALFKSESAVFESRVSITATRTRTWFVNSEGSRFESSAPSARLIAEGSTQAIDGVPLDDAYIAVSDGFDRLPSKEALVKAVAALGERLAGLRSAELLDRYNGPVLFEGQAAAELFAQVFARQLLSRREPLVGDERLANLLSQSGGNGFKDRIGARVLPRFVSITDDPTLAELDGERLLGGYRVDDEGLPAEPTRVIERGYLKTLLSGRTPIAGVPASSGNWRAGGVAPSNLILDASTTLTEEELKAELLLLVEDRGAEFGVVVRRLRSDERGGASREPMAAILGSARGSGGAAPPAVVAFKVYADGREVMLRNVELPGLAAATFKEIVGVGEKRSVYSLPFSPASAGLLPSTSSTSGGLPIVTVAVSSLLFEEVTLRRPSDEIPRLPVAGHPFFQNAR